MKAEILINAEGERGKQQCRRDAQRSCVLCALSHAFSVEIGVYVRYFYKYLLGSVQDWCSRLILYCLHNIQLQSVIYSLFMV